MKTRTVPTHVTTIHEAMCFAWLNYNGQRGTKAQIEKLARQFPVSQQATLERMLAERGIRVGA